MDPTRFDGITKLFADRRLTRRALAGGGAGIAAGALVAGGWQTSAAQDATPNAATPGAGSAAPGQKTEFLFVQGFQSGTMAPREGTTDEFTLVLENGLGSTVYFSNRPERVFGAAPTEKFLDGLGFDEDNPPNAALVMDIGPDDVDIVVMELTEPSYDQASHTATYNAKVLADYERAIDATFQEKPLTEGNVHTEFGSSHLFIDDCADRDMVCMRWDGARGFHREEGSRPLGTKGFCYVWSHFQCEPCFPEQYNDECNQANADFCQGQCHATT